VVFRLLELSEAIEALDAAIEFKSELIAGKEAQIRRSQVLSQVHKMYYIINNIRYTSYTI